MKVRLLGTGAADGIPTYFANTYVNDYARKHGGKDVRTRSAALLDNSIKIDLGPDTMPQLVRDRIDPQDWSAIVFTHSHDDHFAPAELQYWLFPFNDLEHFPYPIYGNEEIVRRIQEMYPDWPIELRTTRSFQCYRIGEYAITPVHANHKPDEDAQNLIFQKDNKTFLYATDTGVWKEPTWEVLQDYRLDLLVIECTEGVRGTDYEGHLGLLEMLEVINRLRGIGTVHDRTQIFTTHHSQNGGATHAELESVMAPHGVMPGYDGLEVEI